MAARIFLWTIASVVALALFLAIGWMATGGRILRSFMVPSMDFAESAEPAPPQYSEGDAWFSRPDVPASQVMWTPAGIEPAQTPRASVFYVHPTTYLGTDRWNAPAEPADDVALRRRRLFMRSQASVFNGVGDIWAPKYRQAVFGSFIAFDRPDAEKAIALAYTDIGNAFETFLAEIPDERPIVLAGPSQGALHQIDLLSRRIAGRPIEKRIAAAYLIGWPISLTADLPALGLPRCTAPAQAGCIISFQSYGEPADLSLTLEGFDATQGLTGLPRAETPLLCTNPLMGGAAPAADASLNLGTLMSTGKPEGPRLDPGLVGAACTGRGYLSLGEDPPEMGRYVMPGNNYHVYDYGLFWANLRADAERRVAAWAPDDT